jgi:phage terminase Nu1 subunit (DNA packaging protein)
MELNVSITQAEFGRLVGVDQSTVSRLLADGILPAGGTASAWLLAYVSRLREQAAARASAGPLDLAQERAALAREQRAGQEIKNGALRVEYAPTAWLREVLAFVSEAMAERLDNLPDVLKKACPQLGEAERNQVLDVIASARNEWVRSTAQLVPGKAMGTDEPDAEAT